jgi:hypothetical protein
MNFFIHHPEGFVQKYMQLINKIILIRQDKNTLRLPAAGKEW